MRKSVLAVHECHISIISAWSISIMSGLGLFVSESEPSDLSLEKGVMILVALLAGLL